MDQRAADAAAVALGRFLSVCIKMFEAHFDVLSRLTEIDCPEYFTGRGQTAASSVNEEDVTWLLKEKSSQVGDFYAAFDTYMQQMQDGALPLPLLYGQQATLLQQHMGLLPIASMMGFPWAYWQQNGGMGLLPTAHVGGMSLPTPAGQPTAQLGNMGLPVVPSGASWQHAALTPTAQAGLPLGASGTWQPDAPMAAPAISSSSWQLYNSSPQDNISGDGVDSPLVARLTMQPGTMFGLSQELSCGPQDSTNNPSLQFLCHSTASGS